MNVLVCVKHVPDTETRVKIQPDGSALDLSGANWVISPYDEFAVEEALRIKEDKEGEVTILTVGGDDAVKSIRQALAMGADKGVLCSDAAFEGSDTLGVARILAAACKQQPYDLIFCGKQGVGADNQQVATLLAEMLGIPSVTVVTQIEYGEGSLLCKREIEGGAEMVRVSTPALVSCQKGLNEPRYPSLKGIMQAKKKEVKTLGASDLELDPSQVGAAAAAFALKKVELPPEKPEGTLIEGEPGDQVKELIRLLREESKVI